MYVIVEEGPAIFVLVSLLFTGTTTSMGCFPRSGEALLPDIYTKTLRVQTHCEVIAVLIPVEQCRWASTKTPSIPAFAYKVIGTPDGLLIAQKQPNLLCEAHVDALLASQVVAGILLGTFPVAFNWVELHGRKPAHTFLDFSLAFMLTAVPCSLALSCTGPKWVFA